MKSEVYEQSMPVYAVCSNSVLFVVTCVCVKKNNYKKGVKKKLLTPRTLCPLWILKRMKHEHDVQQSIS